MMEMSGTQLLVFIAGSAALLLWGARMTRTGMTRAFGGQIRKALSFGTANRFNALFMGLIAAAALQSSTAVGLLTASFSSSAVIGVSAGLAIMLGADVGSALAAQVLSLSIHDFWPVLFFIGFVSHSVFEERNNIGKQAGRILMGLGAIFLSLNSLAQAASVVRDSGLVHTLLTALASEPAIAVVVAALLTWLSHSSLAVLLLLVVLANAGLLSHNHLAFYLVLGVNAGAGLPALVLGLSERPAARRILVGNFVFRVTGVVVLALAIDLWAPALMGLDVGMGQRLVTMHIAMNAVLAGTFIWFSGPMAQLLERFIPDRSEAADPLAAHYLDPAAKEVPDMALSAAARETVRMVGIVQLMLKQAMEAMEGNDRKLCEETARLDDSVDRLYSEIKLYLTDMTRSELNDAESARAFEILSFTTNLEHAGDVVELSLLNTIREKVKGRQEFSEAGFSELMDAYKYVGNTIHLASKVFMEKRVKDAESLIRRKERFRKIEQKSTAAHLARLGSRKPETLATTSYHIDILRDLRRINSLLASCAYPLLESAGKLQDSRVN